MLDIVAIIFLTLSTLSLLGSFPIGIYEFLDLREGFAISDYSLVLETGTYFNVSLIITGLLCGLDSITNSVYKKIPNDLYNLHSLASFTLVGVGLFPLTGEIGWPFSRIIHWGFAFTFLFVYPGTRLLILRYFNKRVFRSLSFLYITLILLAILFSIILEFEYIAYPEYLVWCMVLTTIVVSKVVINKKV